MEAYLQLSTFVIGFGLVAWYVVYISKVRYTTHNYRGPSGRDYIYVVGDRLHYGYVPGLFNGMDVVLDAQLPNIFLDGKVRQRARGSRRFYTSNQRLELEGDFNAYFTCYVPRGYEQLALSILTPDVMQTLIDHVPDCDVEFYQNHVRIIVDHKVYNRPEATTALIEAGERLMAEVDHKLRSWSTADSAEAATASLKSEDNPTVHLLGVRWRLTTLVITLFCSLPSVIIWWLAIAYAKPPQHLSFSWIVGQFGLPFVIFPVMWLFLVVGIPRGWFDWTGLQIRR